MALVACTSATEGALDGSRRLPCALERHDRTGIEVLEVGQGFRGPVSALRVCQNLDQVFPFAWVHERTDQSHFVIHRCRLSCNLDTMTSDARGYSTRSTTTTSTTFT